MFELVPFGRRTNQVVNYDPLKEMSDFFNMNMPERMIAPFATDLIDNGDSFTLNAELPGFNKEDIGLNIENDCLTISAERKAESNEKKTNFIKRERFYGSYKRSFGLEGIDVEKIEASYTNGVLSLKLPKIVEKAPTARSIEIK